MIYTVRTRTFGDTEDKGIEEKSEYYKRVENLFGKLSKSDLKLIIDDFNAKIGREEMYKSVIGSQSFHEKSNENGEKITEVATKLDLRIRGAEK